MPLYNVYGDVILEVHENMAIGDQNQILKENRGDKYKSNGVVYSSNLYLSKIIMVSKCRGGHMVRQGLEAREPILILDEK